MKTNLSNYFRGKKKLLPLVVAEISANHNGSKKKFLDLIKSAAKNGADLIKIQTYEADDISINKFFKINGKKINIWKLYKKAQTPYKWHPEAFKLAKKLGVELFSTPFSIKAVNFLEKLKVKLYKISSFEITDFKLIEKIAKTKKPIIISTGMASLQEIKNCLKKINKYHNKVILLHCVSGYPTLEKESNLLRIKTLKKKFKKNNIGLSDHTNDILTSLSSIPLGAVLIEKHFIMNKKDSSLDKNFSISPNELQYLTKCIKKIFISLGNGKFKIQKSELKSINFRRSIFTTKKILKGEKLTPYNTSTFRPKIGLSADKYYEILNKRLLRDKNEFEPIYEKDINGKNSN